MTAQASAVVPALRVEGTIGLIAPAGPATLDVEKAGQWMRARGYELRIFTGVYERDGYLAGSDAERAADLNAMFADPEVAAIVCIRGGFGAGRLLPLLDYAGIRRHPKPLLGYSDVTALHCALQAQAGLVSFHGTMGSGSWNRFNVEQFRRVFLDRELVEFRNKQDAGDELVQRRNRTMTITGGKAQGELVGGNLSVLVSLAGSPYMPDFRGRILFLEDVSEAPYRIDRMFNTLRLSGALAQIAGFVFGECTDCDPGSGYGSLTLEQILDDYIRPLKVPAYRGAMIGHIREQFIVPVGGRVELDADAGTLRMLEPVFAD